MIRFTMDFSENGQAGEYQITAVQFTQEKTCLLYTSNTKGGGNFRLYRYHWKEGSRGIRGGCMYSGNI